jgi:hypothetical protein
VAAGIIAPALLLISSSSMATSALICAGILAGFMAWRILIFKIGVYEPIMSMNPFHPGN